MDIAGLISNILETEKYNIARAIEILIESSREQ